MKTWYAVLRSPKDEDLWYGSYDKFEAVLKAVKGGFSHIAYCEEFKIEDRYPRYKGTEMGAKTGLRAYEIHNIDELYYV